MEQYSYVWYLEHVTTGKKIILEHGLNIMGRHASCKFVLAEYEFVSRVHVNLVVRHEHHVALESFNPSHGIFINNQRLIGDSCPLYLGDIIGLGVYCDDFLPVVPANHAIFELKKASIDDEVVEVSDDDDGNNNANANEDANADFDELQAISQAMDAIDQQMAEAAEAYAAASTNLDLQPPMLNANANANDIDDDIYAELIDQTIEAEMLLAKQATEAFLRTLD